MENGGGVAWTFNVQAFAAPTLNSEHWVQILLKKVFKILQGATENITMSMCSMGNVTSMDKIA